MYLYYFHVKFKRKYTLEQPSVLIICSAISLHLNTTTTGSGVKRNYTETGTWDEYDVIDIPLRFAISIYNAAISGLLAYARYDREEPSLGRAPSPSDEARLTGSGLKLLLHHDDTPVKTEENPR